MTISISLVKKLCTASTNTIYNLRAELLYPKLLVFENNTKVIITNLVEQNAKNQDQDWIYVFNEEIVDQLLQDNYLWLIFNSGRIQVLDVLNGIQKNIKNDSGISFKIHRIRNFSNSLHFVSDSGDCFEATLNYKELVAKLGEDIPELSLTFKKIHIQYQNATTSLENSEINGLNMMIKSGGVIVKCPVTGLYESISCDVSIQQLVSWKKFAVLVDISKSMRVVDLRDSHVIFEFDKTEANYYVVNAYNDSLYYLLWDNQEIQICCAGFTSTLLLKNVGGKESQDCSQTLKSQEALKAQLKSLADMMISSSKPVSLMSQLQSLFEAVDDFVFLIEIVSMLCQHNVTYKSLLYPLQNRINTTNKLELAYMVSDISIKIDLLEYIQFTGNNCYGSINLFKYDFKELCITFISNSDFDIASICWLKYSQINVAIVADDVVNILNAISHNTKMSAILIWVKNFIPSLLEQNPYYIDIFVRWASERVFMLEQSGYWPKIGLKFVEEIISILDISFKTISIRPISMDDLDLLKTRIHNIMELKEKYKINMLLSELSSQSPNEVALIMLRRCYTEDLEAFLHEYLPSYISQHQFNSDEMLFSHIESEALSSGGGIDGFRLKILLDSFHSCNNKLECLLQVLKVLDVPWHPIVLELAVNTIASTTRTFTVADTERNLAQEIQKELNYASIKVILKKYNFPMACTDYILVLHKITNVAVIEVDDLKVITSVMPAYANYGNVLYIARSLQDCETKVALDYFNSLSLREKKHLLKTIMAKYEQIINGPTNNMIVERNYIDFMKGTQYLDEFEINNIQSLYHFKHSYNLLLNLNNIHSERACEHEVNVWLNNDGTTTSSGRGATLIDLTKANQSQLSMLMALLRRTSTCHKVRKLVECLLNTLSTKDVINESIVPVLSQFKDGENSYLLMDCYNVLIELATKCKEEYLHNIMKLMSIFNALINADIIVKNLSIAWKFHYIFLPILSSSAINNLIYFFTSNQHAQSFGISDFHVKCDFTPFRMISCSLLNSSNSQPSRNLMILEVSKKLLTKVVASQDLDKALLTTLLIILNNVKDVKEKTTIIEILKGQNEVLAPHLMSYLSALSLRRIFIFDDEYNKELGKSVSFPPQYILKSKFNINLADVALPENSEETWDVKVILFYVLLQYPDTSFERLVELCHALNVSTNDGLTLQLISLLSSWELKYKVISNELIGRHIILENNEDQLNKCVTIWDSIDNKDFLIDALNDFWKSGEITLHGRIVSINQYYYEVFLCIHRLIFSTSSEVKNTKEFLLLNFLKEYKRISSPKQYEFELFSVKGMFPEIGYYRLPFHLFMREDMWSNLKSEITLETYERWLPIVALLSLDSDLQTARDMICSNAVKQTMTSRKRNDEIDLDNKHTEPWCLTSREEPLLRAAHRCVRNIANMEWAGACLFYVLQGCARGADQVAAAHLCFRFSQRWAALQPGNRAVRQMERLHVTLSTRHALYKIDWAREEFVRLSAEPAQLIRTLYLHPDFVQKMSRHDVNRAANEIADKNGINISSIRIQILENILDRIGDDKNKNHIALHVKELLTAKYILKATCPKMGAIYLSRIAFDDESEHNKSKKLRALQCLMSVIDQDTAVKVASRERDALWSSLLELLSVVKLENIDMPWIAATYVQDKNRAIEQLLQAAEGNIEGLKVAAELVCRFGSSQTIRNLIPLLLRAGLYEDMSPLLQKIPSHLDNVICSAWRAAILIPFQRADYPISERHKTKCLNAINLLPICPVIKDEDMVEVWKNCCRCKCLGLGCLVLPYMTAQTRQTLLELKKIDRRNLIASLKNLHSETYLVSGAMHVIERMSFKSYR